MSDSSDNEEGSYSSSSHDGYSDDNDDGSGVPLAEVNIQDVIRDRKAERRLKAEAKRQADLQRITDMRSTTGTDPLQRFPKEIWSKILDELDPEDRRNVWHVHPLFHDLMESTRVLDLFLQVLKVDTFRGEIHRHFGSRNEQLRLVSKTTRNSFDHWINSCLTKGIQEEIADSWVSDYDDVTVRFDDARDEHRILKRLLSSFVVEECSGNMSGKCFFPRALTISLMDYKLEVGDDILELFNQYKVDVTTLLRRIGDQIKKFRFFVELNELNLTSPSMYILLQGWAGLMPNLKWLEIYIQPSLPFSRLIDEDTSNQGISVLQKFSFPTLFHLERLTYHTSLKPEASSLNIYDVVLGANQHITMLDLNDEEKLLPPASLTQSLRLTRFTVNQDEYDGTHRNVSCMKRIIPIVNHNWPLNIISLTMESDEENESVSSVLGFLKRFPTLEKVSLRLEGFHVGDTDEYGYMELPKLKEFDLEFTEPQIDIDTNIHFFLSLQFLLECKNLERISWKLYGIEYLKLREHLKRCEKENHEKIIDFRAGLRYSYDSNIWNVFPSLHTLQVSIRRGDDDTVYGGGVACEHEYLREEIGIMSTRRFLNTHECSSSNGDLIRNCVMLVK